jgi:ubiquinol-cytochrome c reductase iron-sulfur subunit
MADRDRERRPERAILAAFGLATLGAIGFALVFSLGGQVQLEGVCLALAFAGLGYGLATWGRRLLPRGPWVEEHEPFEPPPAERAAFEDELERDTRPVARRRLLGGSLGLALGSLGLAALFPLRSLGPRPPAWLSTTPWRAGARLVTKEGELVRAADLEPGELLTVFPEGFTEAGDAPVLLIRVDPAQLVLPGDRAGWAPDGLVAYSKLCTHLGCAVGLYEQESQRLFCPCHESAFDVLRAAQPLAGPATRPLPQLPVRVDTDGHVRAAGGLSDPPGPEYWTRGRS